jgi:hypothetical protein
MPGRATVFRPPLLRAHAKEHIKTKTAEFDVAWLDRYITALVSMLKEKKRADRTG